MKKPCYQLSKKSNFHLSTSWPLMILMTGVEETAAARAAKIFILIGILIDVDQIVLIQIQQLLNSHQSDFLYYNNFKYLMTQSVYFRVNKLFSDLRNLLRRKFIFINKFYSNYFQVYLIFLWLS